MKMTKRRSSGRECSLRTVQRPFFFRPKAVIHKQRTHLFTSFLNRYKKSKQNKRVRAKSKQVQERNKNQTNNLLEGADSVVQEKVHVRQEPMLSLNRSSRPCSSRHHICHRTYARFLVE